MRPKVTLCPVCFQFINIPKPELLAMIQDANGAWVTPHRVQPPVVYHVYCLKVKLKSEGVTFWEDEEIDEEDTGTKVLQ